MEEEHTSNGGLAVSLGLDLGLGLGLHVSENKERKREKDLGSEEEEEGSARKKLRLNKEQSALLEAKFKEHSNLNPVKTINSLRKKSSNARI